MAIAFRSLTSTGYASRTNTVLTAPAGLADGDILLCALVTALTGTAPTPTAAAGFSQIGTATSVTAGGFNGKLWLYWKRAASESGSYTFTHATCSSQGVLTAYSGGKVSGTPTGATINNTGTNPNHNDISTGLSITTTAANSWLLYLAHDWTGSGTLSPPSGMTERFDNLLYSADELISAAGATGNRTQNNASALGEPWATRMVELLVDTGSGTTYNDTTAETASAAETAGGLLTTTKAVAETAAAAETITKTLVITGAVAESASAADTATGLLAFTGAIVEVANAEDTHFAIVIPAGGTLYDETVLETLAANDMVAADVIPSEITPEAPLGGPGPAGEGVRRRFELYLLPEEDEDEPKPRRKRRLRLKKAELEEKIEAAVEYIEAGSPQPMSQNAMVSQVSTLMGLDALLENDRRRVERTIYRYLAAMLEAEEEEEAMALLLAA